MVIPAMQIAENAIISAMRTMGDRHFTLESLKMAAKSDPTKLIATKKTKLEM